MDPILSVLIVTYKSIAEIGPCLRSLPRELDGRNVEVIVVENGSQDGIGALIRQEFPWVNYMELNKNCGFGKANNIAYEQAGGILFFS